MNIKVDRAMIEQAFLSIVGEFWIYASIETQEIIYCFSGPWTDWP